MGNKMWGGRFRKKLNAQAFEFTRSINYDYRLAKFECIGSKLHIEALRKSGFISSAEAVRLKKALDKIQKAVEKGKFMFDPKCEDIHTNIQNAVTKEVGALAFKLQTARSRNEQVVFDLKLFSKSEIDIVLKLCDALQAAFISLAKKNPKLIIPGYTHLQQAQLVYLASYLSAYVEMLERDKIRLRGIRDSIKPALGAGALAGTPIKAGAYKEKVRNSLDAVSDRDFVLEILSALAIVGMHLSRFAEDIIIWCAKEFGFVELDDAFATGSSLMPQKKNPDVLELVRGYTGVLYGNLVSALTIMKGLALTYNRDMQLDKQSLFSSFDIVEKELKVLAGLIATMRFNKTAIEKRIRDESFYATDLVYLLVRKGIPFKNAHDIIGRLMRHAGEKGIKVKDLDNTYLKRFSDKLNHAEIIKIMNPEASVRSRL